MNKYRDFDNYLKEFPSKDGYFGPYGGAYLSEELNEAFLQADEAYRPALKKAGFLTRDSRMKERKKYGLKAARRASQFSKR